MNLLIRVHRDVHTTIIMSSNQIETSYDEAEKWMNYNFPKCKKIDVYWTMEKYDYPEYVRNWIKQTWTKESDQNGGTYVKSNV